MDFGDLLRMAESNNDSKNFNPKNCLITKFSPPQKDPKQMRLSENIQRLKQQRNVNESAKKKADDEKRRNLLLLRADNKKTTRTARAMVSMTKSADKSAISGSKHSYVTASDDMRHQCDEDDYGYESNVSRALFEKIMSKYEENPDEDPMDRFTKSGNKKKIADLQATKNRVRERLALGDDSDKSSRSHSHKETSHTSKHSTSTSSYSGSSQPKEEETKKKPTNTNKPPPPSFADLIKMAQQSKAKPFEAKPKADKEYEFERPMTSKEKEEYQRELASKARKAGKVAAASGNSVSGKPSILETALKGGSFKKGAEGKADDAKSSSLKGKESQSSKSSADTKKPIVKPKPDFVGPEFHPAVINSRRPALSSGSHNGRRPVNDKEKLPLKGTSSSFQSKKQDQGNHMKRARSRSRSPVTKKPMKRAPSRSPSPDFRKRPNSKNTKSNRIESDESEYDSEMDDFIDDSDAKVDVSSEIRKIFGYDRRNYRNEADFDDRSMENNRFADVMREEARSARLGRLEDLEDMRREEEEKRRKAMKKKQMMKKR